MEKVVVEVQFLYAPKVGQCAVIVSTENEQTQMSIEELKEQYPMLCDGLSQMFKPNTVEWPWTTQDECCYGTLHNVGDECNCAEYQ